MSSIPEVLEQLHASREKIAEARDHAYRANELVREARKAIVDAHGQANSWHPPQLDKAIEILSGHTEKLSAIDDLLNDYGARL